jgi:oxygen-independent coproporphyrinogen-3 oxidase
VDLIYGLPFQNMERFRRTLQTIVDARPDRIATYNYAHLPRMVKAQRLIREDDLPSPAEKLGLLQGTVQFLTEAGYEYIGMDHFARPGDELVRARDEGTLHRNFQGYSTYADCDLRRRIIQNIMCQDRVDMEAVGAANDLDFRSCFAAALGRLETMQRDGLVELDEREIRVTPKGRFLLRPIAMAFDAYLEDRATPNRFSRVI